MLDDNSIPFTEHEFVKVGVDGLFLFWSFDCFNKLDALAKKFFDLDLLERKGNIRNFLKLWSLDD